MANCPTAKNPRATQSSIPHKKLPCVWWPSLFSPSRILWKAVSTLVESRAEVSMKERPSFSEKFLESSVGTDRRCLKSDLFPAHHFKSYYSTQIFCQEFFFKELSTAKCFCEGIILRGYPCLVLK